MRDLCPHGDDLLVLAGPSMSLSGPVRVHRWVGAGSTEVAGVVRAGDLPVVLELPHGRGEDHAEGLAVLPPGAHGTEHGEQLLVVLDSPAALRLTTEHAVLADVWDLPPA
ncbi:DUF3616 domain-containing protein [Kineococcus gypseus]|uniref:DUF3616 domain-containing protein n=1 Tax=Kineococcus gypseus TaxID=1637102 RepID=UPI003D7DDF1D